MHEIKLPNAYAETSVSEVPYGMFGIRLGDQPSHEVIESFGLIEIRYYDPQTLVSITVKEDEDEDEAFLTLAKYVYGHNSSATSMVKATPTYKNESMTSFFMTAPLIHSKIDEQLTLSFVLPQEFTVSTSPEPLDTRIFLLEKPSHMRAVIKFNGEQNGLEQEQTIIEWIRNHPTYMQVGQMQTAQYDSPNLRPFLKRHEVQIEVIERQ